MSVGSPFGSKCQRTGTDGGRLTIEGAEDDMCSPGQTAAAHDLCGGIPPADHHHHLQPGVGHYGVFAGSRWNEEIYPVFRDFVATRSAAHTAS